jgi:hypothetical protein
VLGSWTEGAQPVSYVRAVASCGLTLFPGVMLMAMPVCRGRNAVPEDIEDQVVEVFRGVGKLLSRFTVGKIPKAFKIIPNLKNWEEVLFLTDPESWTPHAVYQVSCSPTQCFC